MGVPLGTVRGVAHADPLQQLDGQRRGASTIEVAVAAGELRDLGADARHRVERRHRVLQHLGDAPPAGGHGRRVPGRVVPVEQLAADSLARDVMGPLMHDTFVGFKRREWDEYHTHVSDWERDRYLRMF